MKKYIRNWVIFALACVSAMAAPIISNASFEQGISDVGTFTQINAASRGLRNWTVSGHSIDYIGSYWEAKDGSRSVDLNGLNAGGISQLVGGFTVGGYYELSFYLAGNRDGGPAVKNLTLSVGDLSQDFSFDTSTLSRAGMGWAPRTFGFIANAAALDIKFESKTAGPYGPALDNLSLTEDLTGVPEPASMALIGLGLTALGLIRRRR